MPALLAALPVVGCVGGCLACLWMMRPRSHAQSKPSSNGSDNPADVADIQELRSEVARLEAALQRRDQLEQGQPRPPSQ